MLRHRPFRFVLSLTLLGALAVAHPALAVWTHKTRLTRTPESEEYPRITAVGCFVHVVWIDLDNRDLHYARSADAGATWSTPQILVTSPPGLPVIQAEIAATGRQMHVVWQQGAYDQASIHHRRSENRGKTWGRPRILSTPGRASEQPTMAVDGRAVHVAWIQTRAGSDTKPVKLFVARSLDRGKHWEKPRRLGRRSIGLSSPVLAAGGGRLHVFWGHRPLGAGPSQIFNRSSADHARSWSPRRVAVENDGWFPSSIAISGDTVHLLWAKYQYKLAHVEYQRSSDAGRSWSAPQQLDDGSVASLGVSGDRIEAVWARDWDGAGPLIYSRSDDGGTSWPVRRQIGRSGRFPALAVATGQGRCAGAAHLAYGKTLIRNEQFLREIFHKRSPKILP
jgi:hypothetical protein